MAPDLRAVSGHRSWDSDATGLVAQLRQRSEEFEQLWEEREVALRGSTGSGSCIPPSA
ncbi:MmyB family transcriptional regulator [Streptomyces sp. NBC_01462]|uniref:MmyB family transcriptional regulator n=1 Tax=Streptomyces sp. NBC_01462 TaxID=2903876 RepID=UPI002E32AC3D|nr:hypothetical protein [Streptomyces sp. NBC_01462]